MTQHLPLAALAFNIFILHLLPSIAVLAQSCYFPNGDLDTQGGTIPCSSSGGACCPDKWACAANGLCYYAPDDLWGRYTCTDETWSVNGPCPNYCTYNHQANGGESVKQCADGHWCCNANGVSIDCCKMSNVQIIDSNDFELLTTAVAGAASSTASPFTSPASPSIATSSIASGLSSSLTSATLSSASFSTYTEAPVPPVAPVTFTTQLTSLDSAGVATTIFVVQTITPFPSDTPQPAATAAATSGKSNNTGLIAGVSTGVPVLLALVAAAFLLYRRHHKKRYQPAPIVNEKPYPYPPIDPNDMIDMYTNTSKPPAEIDSIPIAANTTRRSKSDHQSQISELSAGPYPAQRASVACPTSPAISSLSLRTSDLPQYSPTGITSRGVSMLSSGGGNGGNVTLPHVQEEGQRPDGPIELWGSLPPTSSSSQQLQPEAHASQSRVQDWATAPTNNITTATTSYTPYRPPQEQQPPPPAIYQPYRPRPIQVPANEQSSLPPGESTTIGSPFPNDQDRGQIGPTSGLRVVN